MDCHFQIFADQRWQEAAVLSVTQPELGGVRGSATLEYDLQYAFSSIKPQPVSLAEPVTADILRTKHWPPFLFDLIPQGNGRKYLLGQLGLADDHTADFALLRAGAFNPIGRLRIREAVDFYRNHAARFPEQNVAGGMNFDDVVARGEEFVERMLIHGMLAAGTTGVQGAAPKFLLTRDRNSLWHADGVLPDADAAAHFIVKLPRGKTEADRKVLKNEAAYMRVAAALGARVHGEVALYGDMLFIPRFDRRVTADGVERLHQESAASLAGIVGYDARPSQFTLLAAIRNVVTDKTGETIEFLRRDVLNLALRNTDNHARNTAVHLVDGVVRLTPLFDFAPMYLDPEGIPRAARWHHPDTGKELTTWGDVIDTLRMDPDERRTVRQALAAFGSQLPRLPDTMRQAGVDDDITEYLTRAIDEQARQLREFAGD